MSLDEQWRQHSVWVWAGCWGPLCGRSPPSWLVTFGGSGASWFPQAERGRRETAPCISSAPHPRSHHAELAGLGVACAEPLVMLWVAPSASLHQGHCCFDDL